jgi:Zn-dependent protease with chaperone function
MRWAVAWAQYLALTPNNLAMVATAQYQTMLGHANVLPENHQTTIRIKRITDRLIQAIKHDPSINTEMLNRMKWEVHVIDAKTINAFCMPGGKMAIYTGIIDQLHLTDDEIAVVMWHEITHALREHSYTSMKTRLATNVAISAAWAYTWRHMYAADIANWLWQLSHSREHEREADTGGLDIVRMAGYDVCAGGKVWDKMQSLSKLSPTEFFSTHPASADRANKLREQAKRSGWKC